MKALFITTETNETQKHYQSFASLGNEYKTYIYSCTRWPSNQGLDAEILVAARDYRPDVIFYVGACNPNTPSIDCFSTLRKTIAPTVHLCSDAADDPWWPYLIRYDKNGAFSVQVSMDGNRNWPLFETQVTALTPFSRDHFPQNPLPHSERPIHFGFAGAFGIRSGLISEMGKFGLKCRKRDAERNSYSGYVNHLSNSRIVVNFARTGTQKYMHVKGRIVESALSGAMVLEQRGSPTSDWFEAGVDYMEYGSPAEAKVIVERLANRPDESQSMALRLREKVLAEHSPEKFWARITDRLK